MFQLEFEVKNVDKDKLKVIQECLRKQAGIHGVSTSPELDRVFVETDLPSSVAHRFVEAEFKSIAVLKGMGATNLNNNETFPAEAAVSIISNFDENVEPVRGVIRFVQLNPSKCAIDGTVDGLSCGNHGIAICEYGDISDGCERYSEI
jgi:copper chaperone for superoxide dismutase